MYWREIGYLCKESITLDKMNRPKKVLSEKEVFCNKKSVRQSEFYQANIQGYKPELMIEIRSLEYNKATHFKIDGIIYRIIRTYDRGEITELTLISMVNENGKEEFK